jgi:hypothetical protein
MKNCFKDLTVNRKVLSVHQAVVVFWFLQGPDVEKQRFLLVVLPGFAAKGSNPNEFVR